MSSSDTRGLWTSRSAFPKGWTQEATLLGFRPSPLLFFCTPMNVCRVHAAVHACPVQVRMHVWMADHDTEGVSSSCSPFYSFRQVSPLYPELSNMASVTSQVTPGNPLSPPPQDWDYITGGLTSGPHSCTEPSSPQIPQRAYTLSH